MATSAGTPAPGLPRPAWPSHPVPPSVPVEEAGKPVRPAADADPDAPPAPARGPVELPPITAEERALDPRTIARASLAAGRNRSLWWTAAGVTAAVAVSFVLDAVAGVVVLAVLLLVYAVVRAVAPPPGPPAVVVRSRALDVTVLAVSAVTLAVLASVVPTG